MPRTNLKFTDLNSLSSLKKLDESFLRYLSIHSPEIEEQIIYYRELGSSKLGAEAYSKFITQIGSITDDFIADLFQIDTENLAQKKDYEKFDPIYEARRKFIQRYVTKEYTKDSVSKLNFEEITNKLKAIIGEITQEKLANAIINWQLDSSQYQQRLELAAQYCAFMYYNNSTLSLFDVPRPVDENNHIREHKIKQLAGEPYIGFDYRDHMLSDE
jgi:hypothetical protein